MNIPGEKIDRNKAWVLVIDDEEPARRSLNEILRLEGFQVEQAANATQAIEQLKQRHFDAILLDLRMPLDGTSPGFGITDERAGLVVLHYVAEFYPDIPVIFLTAHGSMETAIDALRHDAEDYLLKPASPEQIISALDHALITRQATLQNQAQSRALKRARSIMEELNQSFGKLEISLQGLMDDAAQSDRPSHSLQADHSLSTDYARTNSNSMPMRSSDEFEVLRGITIDLARREIRQNIDGASGSEPSVKRISLTPTEGRLLQVFLENSGKVYSHQELIFLVQGYETSSQEAPELLRPLVSRLRQKLDSFPDGRRWIRSIRGIGYMFEVEQPALM